MIKAVSFDFYNTLVKFWPALEDIQEVACGQLGISVSKAGISRGYSKADVVFNRANEDNPLALRSEEERLDFFAGYEQIILETAGVSVSNDLARRIWTVAMSVPKDFMLFDDAIPALRVLHAKGYRLGVISNLRRDMDQLCQRLGLAQYLDFCVNSVEAGWDKPHAPIFRAALSRSAVAPEDSLHVGDQYRSDVLGARGVGMHSVLLDRGGWHDDNYDCATISSLTELVPLLDGAPDSLNHQEGDRG